MNAPPARQPGDPTLYETLRLMIRGGHLLQAINACVALGIPDLLKDGPMGGEEIARRTDTHPLSLYRLMRALAAAGLFVEEGGRFGLTPLGTLLRADVPNSLHAMTRHVASERHYTVWANLLHSVRTGESARKYAPWDSQMFEEDPEYAATFARRMTEAASQRAAALLAGYDFTGVATLADIGGGHGRLLGSILRAHPRMRGILFDLAPVVEGAHRVLETAGVTDRCRTVGGSFFDGVPGGADAYILSMVIHDWDDEHATAILRNCRTAAGGSGRILLLERVMPDDKPSLEHGLGDLEMLVGPGGRERTGEEYRALFTNAGLRLSRIVPLAYSYYVVEGVAA